MPARPIIIDCDPGVDDAIALLLAFASPELDILGITTVAGNVPLALTQKNARKVCELAGRTTTPVFAGCPRPMLRLLATAEYVHGVSGLDGANLPDPQMPLQPQHSVDFLIETLMASPEEITVATLGPLTNLAIALVKEPKIADKIAEVVIMGGAITQGNVTASAEFNIYVDPHAAYVVFTSGIKLTLVSLDVTHQVLTTRERLNRIRSLNTPVSRAAADLLAFYGSYESGKFSIDGSPLHDPCVIAYLIQPDLFTSFNSYVAVETNSELTMGRTVIGVGEMLNPKPNSTIIQSIDAPGFYDLLVDRLARL